MRMAALVSRHALNFNVQMQIPWQRPKMHNPMHLIGQPQSLGAMPADDCVVEI